MTGRLLVGNWLGHASAFYRTNIRFGKHWALGALAAEGNS